MKKLILLLILSFFSIQSFAGSCTDGSDPVKSISADGTYFVYKCAGTKESNKTSASSSNKSSKGIEINTYGGEGYISENENPNFDSLRWSLYRKLHYRPIRAQRFYSVQASNPFNFQFDLREDAYIKQQMQTTPLLSYLLYEDGKIVVDEITPRTGLVTCSQTHLCITPCQWVKVSLPIWQVMRYVRGKLRVSILD